jgi:hypothetical protein
MQFNQRENRPSFERLLPSGLCNHTAARRNENTNPLIRPSEAKREHHTRGAIIRRPAHFKINHAPNPPET